MKTIIRYDEETNLNVCKPVILSALAGVKAETAQMSGDGDTCPTLDKIRDFLVDTVVGNGKFIGMDAVIKDGYRWHYFGDCGFWDIGITLIFAKDGRIEKESYYYSNVIEWFLTGVNPAP